jgi:addiction module RelE/StbE family toxin
MDVLFSDEFKERYFKIKDLHTQLRIMKQIEKLRDFPESGKPLRYELKGYRTVRIPPFRLIYRIEDDKIIIICFDQGKTSMIEDYSTEKVIKRPFLS